MRNYGPASDLAVNAYNPKPGADNRAYRQALLTQKIELEKQAAQHGLTDPKLRDHYLQFGPDGVQFIEEHWIPAYARIRRCDKLFCVSLVLAAACLKETTITDAG